MKTKPLQNLLLAMLFLTLGASAHVVDYDVARHEGVVVTTRMGGEEASYSEYEVFAPADQETPFQLGRTDALGRLIFLPNAPGTWVVKVKADSQHGVHGVVAEVDVDDQGVVKDISQPLVATHTRLLIGISLLIGIFGLISLARARGQASKP